MNLIQIKNKLLSYINPSFQRDLGNGFFDDISKWVEQNLEGQVFSSREMFEKITKLYHEGFDCPVFSTKVNVKQEDWFKHILQSIQKTLDQEGVAYLTHSELVFIICQFYNLILSRHFQDYVCLKTGGFYYQEDLKVKIANMI